MPLLKHAKKKQRQDIKKTVAQKNQKVHYKQLIKAVRENPSQEALDAAYKAIDKAAKINLIHDNKAAHLKSDVAKAIAGKVTAAPKKTTTKATAKPAAKKIPAKKTAPKKK
jgi:small subunit ribosomal protein S20